MRAQSQTATTWPPMRGRRATSTPAAISITPTTIMIVWALNGSTSVATGARYWSQSTSTSKNLSGPARMGAATKATCRIRNACRARAGTAAMGPLLGAGVAICLRGAWCRRGRRAYLLGGGWEDRGRARHQPDHGVLLGRRPDCYPPVVDPAMDPESRAWVAALAGQGSDREAALDRLPALLLRAAGFELGRRRGQLAGLSAAERHDLATQAADDAMMGVLARLDDFRGLSRFTTWAYKFALLEAATKARRMAWRHRELPRPPE